MGNKKLIITAILGLILTNIGTVVYFTGQNELVESTLSQTTSEFLRYSQNLEGRLSNMTNAHNKMYELKNEASKMITVYDDDPRYQTEIENILRIGEELKIIYEENAKLEEETRNIRSQSRYIKFDGEALE